MRIWHKIEGSWLLARSWNISAEVHLQWCPRQCPYPAKLCLSSTRQRLNACVAHTVHRIRNRIQDNRGKTRPTRPMTRHKSIMASQQMCIIRRSPPIQQAMRRQGEGSARPQQDHAYVDQDDAFIGVVIFRSSCWRLFLLTEGSSRNGLLNTGWDFQAFQAGPKSGRLKLTENLVM